MTDKVTFNVGLVRTRSAPLAINRHLSNAVNVLKAKSMLVLVKRSDTHELSILTSVNSSMEL